MWHDNQNNRLEYCCRLCRWSAVQGSFHEWIAVETDSHILFYYVRGGSPYATVILSLFLAGCLGDSLLTADWLAQYNEWQVLQPPAAVTIRFIAFIRSIKLFNRVLLRSKVNAVMRINVNGWRLLAYYWAIKVIIFQVSGKTRWSPSRTFWPHFCCSCPLLWSLARRCS